MSKLTLRNHPLRDVLDKELRQRTFPALNAPCRLCHFTFTVASASRQLEFSLMQQHAEQQGAHLSETDQDLNIPLFAGTLRWERHGEFSSYTFILPGNAPALFDDPLSFLPSYDWFDALPGQVLRVVQLTILPAKALPAKGDMQRARPNIFLLTMACKHRTRKPLETKNAFRNKKTRFGSSLVCSKFV